MRPDQGIFIIALFLFDIKSWMGDHFLQLNENIYLAHALSSSLGPLQANIRAHVKNLGVVFDSELKFDKQINSVMSASFFQVRALRKLKSLLSFGDLETVIHAFISPMLDYYNALYAGVNQFSLFTFATGSKCCSPLLNGEEEEGVYHPYLHWLPVKCRIDYKILTFAFKALHVLAPVYISDLKCISETTPFKSLHTLGS